MLARSNKTESVQSSPLKELTLVELAAWRGFLRLHSALVRELDRELETEHGLPLTQYEVLIHLDRAPGRRLRMSELASSVLLSQSGITRLVDRMERDGLVSRSAVPGDRRCNAVTLTPPSKRLLRQIETIAAELRRDVLAGLTREEIRTLHALLAKAKQRMDEMRA